MEKVTKYSYTRILSSLFSSNGINAIVQYQLTLIKLIVLNMDNSQTIGSFNNYFISDKLLYYVIKTTTRAMNTLVNVRTLLQTWERDGSWLYCIDFLREEEHPYSWRYRYAVKWSIPTRRRPIPRATASVYITIEVSKFKPKVKQLQIISKEHF